MTEKQDLLVSSFSSWLRRTRSAQLEESGVDVPCGACNACCRSSYFIHIRPEETQTLARIPGEFLFPAPGLPQGNVLLGYDENGRCPLLSDAKVYDVFLKSDDESGKTGRLARDPEVVKAVKQANEKFGAGRDTPRVHPS